MIRWSHRTRSPVFTAKVALAAIRDEKTLSELVHQYDVHVKQVTTRKSLLLNGAAGVVGSEKADAASVSVDLKALPAKIGELALENYFVRSAQQGRSSSLKTMIDPDLCLPLSLQAKVLSSPDEPKL